MSLERQDVRAKLDHELHAQLKAICQVDGVDMGEFIEAALRPVIHKRVHDAILLAADLARQGITGNFRENPGIAGNGRDLPGASGR